MGWPVLWWAEGAFVEKRVCTDMFCRSAPWLVCRDLTSSISKLSMEHAGDIYEMGVVRMRKVVFISLGGLVKAACGVASPGSCDQFCSWFTS